jgi:hypothetical protein
MDETNMEHTEVLEYTEVSEWEVLLEEPQLRERPKKSGDMNDVLTSMQNDGINVHTQEAFTMNAQFLSDTKVNTFYTYKKGDHIGGSRSSDGVYDNEIRLTHLVDDGGPLCCDRVVKYPLQMCMFAGKPLAEMTVVEKSMFMSERKMTYLEKKSNEAKEAKHNVCDANDTTHDAVFSTGTPQSHVNYASGVFDAVTMGLYTTADTFLLLGLPPGHHGTYDT